MPDDHRFEQLDDQRVRCIDCGETGFIWEWSPERRRRHRHEQHADHDPAAEERRRYRAKSANARRRHALKLRQEHREQILKAEWEKWRHRRSKLSATQRRGQPMMEVGQRECRWCGGYFTPATLRQRFCSPTCRKTRSKRRMT